MCSYMQSATGADASSLNQTIRRICRKMKVEVLRARLVKGLRTKNQTLREAMAELLSTCVLMTFGLATVAQVVLGKYQYGRNLSINLAFGFGVTMGMHIAGGVSGAHMNPAVSLTNCVLGNLPWRMLPVYVAAQSLGSFLAAGIVFFQYYEAIMDYTGGNLTVTGPAATAGIFSTYPAAYLSTGGGFLDQVLGTAVLLLCILAVHDERNNPAAKGTQAIVVGIAVALIGMAMGMNAGYAINPARDIGPRIFTAIAGWGTEVFWARDYWFWVPVVAPLVGGLIGACFYKLLVELHHPPVPVEEEKDSVCQQIADLTGIPLEVLTKGSQ